MAHRKTFKGREARPENPEKGQIFSLTYGSSTSKYATQVLYCFESSFSQSSHIYSAFINKEACDTLDTFDSRAGLVMTSLVHCWAKNNSNYSRASRLSNLES